MYPLVVDPNENRDRHCKVYVEPSIYAFIKDFQLKHGLFSFSEAARELILIGASAISMKTSQK